MKRETANAKGRNVISLTGALVTFLAAHAAAGQAAPTLFGYEFPSEPIEYGLKINFDGYLPVLGGIEQKVELAMGILVQAKGKDAEGNPQALSSLKAFAISLLDQTTGRYEPLPLGLDNAREYFPDTTISHLASGRVLKTSAPKLELPLQLPGLHTQHVPEITFMLLQFPEDGVEAGKPWTYTRVFGDSRVTFDITYKGRDEEAERFDLRLSQSYSGYEDDNGNPVAAGTGATRLVKTSVSGSGTVWFEGRKGAIVRAKVTADAESAVLSLSEGAAPGQPKATRRLKTTFTMQRKEKA